MRRRKLRWVLAGLAVLVGTAGLIVQSPQPPSRITRENYYRVREGMTRAEVEAILGPPGDYRTSLGETACVGPEPWSWDVDLEDYCDRIATWQHIGGKYAERQSSGIWRSDSIEIGMFSDDDSGRILTHFVCGRRTTGSPLEKLFWRAKRQWHRWFP
jgi:hypothetical protein